MGCDTEIAATWRVTETRSCRKLMAVMRAVTITCALSSCALGCGDPGFVCERSTQCGAEGACEPEGWCSFPDAACESGRRFGAHTGDGLAERCVPMAADASSSTTSTGTTTTSSGDELAGTSEATAAQRETETMGTTDPPSTTGDPTGEPVDPTLLVWLTFDDRNDLFADRTDNGFHAQCEIPEHCPIGEDGPRGLAARFDGIDDHLRLPDPDALVTPDAFTFALWIRIDAVATGAYQDVFARAFGELNWNSWAIGFPNNYAGARAVVHDGTTEFVVGQAEWDPASGFHHVACTWDGARAVFYIDAAVVGEVEVGAIGFDGHEVLVGADTNSGVLNNFFGGAVDDARLYSRALTEDEIAALVAG